MLETRKLLSLRRTEEGDILAQAMSVGNEIDPSDLASPPSLASWSTRGPAGYIPTAVSLFSQCQTSQGHGIDLEKVSTSWIVSTPSSSLNLNFQRNLPFPPKVIVSLSLSVLYFSIRHFSQL